MKMAKTEGSVRPVFTRPRLTSTILKTLFKERGVLYNGGVGDMLTYTFTPAQLHTKDGVVVELIFEFNGDTETSAENHTFSINLNSVEKQRVIGMNDTTTGSENFTLSCLINDNNITNTVLIQRETGGANNSVIRGVECVARIVE